MEHDVRVDYVGLKGRARFTCFSQTCQLATLIRQPYMSTQVWSEKVAGFFDHHPCNEVKDDGFRG